MRSVAVLVSVVALWSCILGASPASAQAPEGEMRWALYVTISPSWFDPGESGVAGLNSFWIGYALHDALVKPMPGNPRAASLAESWTLSADRRVYEFKLREGLKFHNGDPFTAEDVRFTFLRHKSKVFRVLRDPRVGGGLDRAEGLPHPRRRRGIQEASHRSGTL